MTGDNREFAIGQAWETQNGRAEIVAVGPDFIGYKKIPGGTGIADIGYFRRAAIYLLPPKPIKHELWVNVYRNVRGAYIIGNTEKESRSAADAGARYHDGTYDPTRIACLKIEFEEGEGLG